jgi:hypothetical protein
MDFLPPRLGLAHQSAKIASPEPWIAVERSVKWRHGTDPELVRAFHLAAMFIGTSFATFAKQRNDGRRRTA